MEVKTGKFNLTIIFDRYFKRKAEIDDATKGNKKKQQLIDDVDVEGKFLKIKTIFF